MGRGIHRLTALQIERARRTGKTLCDGGGLYLVDWQSWFFRYKRGGKQHWMALGPLALVDLKQARELAHTARLLLHAGIEPLAQRAADRAQAALAAAKTMTFDECRAAYLDAHGAGWKNPKHRQQWENTLATYASPVLGKLPVQDIDTGLVLRVLEPIWKTKPETASRTRGRLENVLGWATVRGYRSGENPARWRDHLDHLLPAKSKVRTIEHHAALSYDQLPTFMAQLHQQPGVSARALEFLICTTTRSAETLGATWDEVDVAGRLWIVPASRMKRRREHRVPLNDAALAVLKQMQGIRQSDYIFPGARNGRPLSEMALLMLLRRMQHANITAHGFRSTFRDWAAERTHFPSEVAEMALAHAVSGKVEAAYRRGDLFQKRVRLMAAWGDYATKMPTQETGGSVVALRAK
jgi:integrase